MNAKLHLLTALSLTILLSACGKDNDAATPAQSTPALQAAPEPTPAPQQTTPEPQTAPESAEPQTVPEAIAEPAPTVTTSAINTVPASNKDIASAEDLAKAKSCMTCHRVDSKLIGPSYKEVAAKYAGQKDAIATLSEKVIKGGTGVWGNVPMTPNNVTPDEAKILVSWVMTLK